MAVTIIFEPKAGADARYDGTVEALKAKGMWPPEGLVFHVAFGEGADFRVVEVWESGELARTFGESLMPILQDHGIELMGEPHPQLVKNMMAGKALPTA